MTKLLCTADLHLHEWPGLAPVDRLDDQAAVLDRIVDLAIERDVDAVLIAGDVFHRPNPTPRTLNVFRDFARRLVVQNIDVLAITGNASHDIENADRFCALELFDDIVDVHRGPSVWLGRGGLSVVCLPSVPMANLVARAGGGDRDQIHAEAAQLLVDTAGDLRSGDGPSVLLAHWSVSGAAFPNGLPVDAAREPVLPISDLEALAFDAVVLGHIHRAQVLDDHTSAGRAGPIFYCGSPMPLDFGETGFAHGVFILDAAVGASTTEFVPIESRPFVTFDLADAEQWAADAAGDPLWFAVVNDAIVRVRYTATPEQQRRLDTKQMRDAFMDAGAALVRIQPEIVRADRARVAGLDEQLGELDAVQRWNVAQGVEAPHDAELVDLTRDYLETTVT